MKINFKYSSIKESDIFELEREILEIVGNFEKGNCLGEEYAGWREYPLSVNDEVITRIKDDAKNIIDNHDVFVVCGIGGSYLGARAVIEAINGFVKSNSIDIVYLGNTFDERYTNDVLNYLKDKDFFVNVISKSGSTLETAFAFRKLKELLKDRYGDDYNKHIIATTDKEKGCLREMAVLENYSTYAIPENIGGRYSVFTPVGLLPIAVAGIDVEKFIEGAKSARFHVLNEKFENNLAYKYSAYRYLNYKNGKNIEVLSTYSPYLNMLSEWWKQLFGESEGKDGKGIFPASVTFSTDLHSLGQFIQQGSKNLFITQLLVEESGNLKVATDGCDVDKLNYIHDLSLADLNYKAQIGTSKAHHETGGVNNAVFEVGEVNENTIGYIMYIYMYACMIGSYLMGVNPFDQPGVEFYKREMKKLLQKK